MKMVKVGFILGGLFIIIAICVFFFISRVDSPTVDNENSKPQVENNNFENSEIDEPIVSAKNEVQPEEVEEVEQVEQVIETTVVKEISSVKTIDESSLKKSLGVQEVICVISNKRVLLIDENPDGSSAKMLSYCFDVLTPSNKSLTLFITRSVYDSYKVGDRLTVIYETYTNDINVEFPIVISVTSVDR